MKKVIVLIGVMFASWNINVYSQDYQKNLAKCFKDIFGKQYNGFTFQQMPFDNFGLITSFHDESTFGNFLCDMFFCIGKTPPTNFPDWLSMYNFAAVGSSQSTISLKQKVQNDFALKMTLPKLFSVMGINFDGSSKKVKSTTLDLGSFYLRLLRPGPWITYINSLSESDPVKKDFIQGTLVWISGDIVAEKIDMTISVDADLSAQIDAQINASGAMTTITGDNQITFKAGRTASGTYHFVVDKPVVIAYLVKKQSGAGTLSGLNLTDPIYKTDNMNELANYWGKFSDYSMQLKPKK